MTMNTTVIGEAAFRAGEHGEVVLHGRPVFWRAAVSVLEGGKEDPIAPQGGGKAGKKAQALASEVVYPMELWGSMWPNQGWVLLREVGDGDMAAGTVSRVVPEAEEVAGYRLLKVTHPANCQFTGRVVVVGA